MFSFDNSYARLPPRFFERRRPVAVAAPALLVLNEPLAVQLGLDPTALSTPEGVAILSGSAWAPGSDPIAMAYAGHQFGRFVPQLGDGRAMLIGELIDTGGIRRDVHLKGSGSTSFSRRGDGRAALGPVLREYLISEAFAALGIPTTRALAVATIGEVILREEGLVAGAVLTRIAASHVRVGTFQYFAARGDVEGLRILANYVIDRHYRDAAKAPNPYRALLEAVIDRQAALISKWLLVGFIHGVMNTDNMAISGETLDFGPCAFLDAYDPNKIFSAIDRSGRYAYANQPVMAHWNLARFAETLLPLLADDSDHAVAYAQDAIGTFTEKFEALHAAGFARKLGLTDVLPGDQALIDGLLTCMADHKADFTLVFQGLCALANPSEGPTEGFALPLPFDSWLQRWRNRLLLDATSPAGRQAAMRGVNPAVIPRNHRVEEALAAAADGDMTPFHTLQHALARPYEDRPEFATFADPPRPDQIVRHTFCGT